jgi:hypothetical protein
MMVAGAGDAVNDSRGVVDPLLWHHPERSRFSGGAKDLPLHWPCAQANRHAHRIGGS